MSYLWLVRLYVSMGTSLIDVWCLNLFIYLGLVLKMHCDDYYFLMYKICGNSGTYVRKLRNLW
jgi:hypothetical protein